VYWISECLDCLPFTLLHLASDFLEKPDIGVFRIIYPHSYAEFLKSGKTTEDLVEILRVVHLAYLPEREGGWATIKEWRDVLSGGEKQRVC